MYHIVQYVCLSKMFLVFHLAVIYFLLVSTNLSKTKLYEFIQRNCRTVITNITVKFDSSGLDFQNIIGIDLCTGRLNHSLDSTVKE